MNSDFRVKNWFLINPSWPLFLLLGVWVWFVKLAGPKYMEDKKPWNLKSFIFYYNIFQIITNALMILQSLRIGLFTKITLGCEVVHPTSMGIPLDVRKQKKFSHIFTKIYKKSF